MSRESLNQVWVGNVPYDATEDELRQVMERCGPVVNIRIRYDKDTGQSRGFAFCEYRDPETCAIALRNISGTVLRGRALRVDWATAEMKHRYQSALAAAGIPLSAKPPSGRGGVDVLKSSGTSALSPPITVHEHHHANNPHQATATLNNNQTILGPNSVHTAGNQQFAETGKDGSEPECGRAPPPTTTSPSSVTAQICDVVNSMSAAQLFYVVGHMQKLVMQAPATARALLTQNPQLCYALLHVEFLLGLIDAPTHLPASPADVQRAVEFQALRQREARNICCDVSFADRNLRAATAAHNKLDGNDDDGIHRSPPTDDNVATTDDDDAQVLYENGGTAGTKQPERYGQVDTGRANESDYVSSGAMRRDGVGRHLASEPPFEGKGDGMTIVDDADDDHQDRIAGGGSHRTNFTSRAAAVGGRHHHPSDDLLSQSRGAAAAGVLPGVVDPNVVEDQTMDGGRSQELRNGGEEVMAPSPNSLSGGRPKRRRSRQDDELAVRMNLDDDGDDGRMDESPVALPPSRRISSPFSGRGVLLSAPEQHSQLHSKYHHSGGRNVHIHRHHRQLHPHGDTAGVPFDEPGHMRSPSAGGPARRSPSAEPPQQQQLQPHGAGGNTDEGGPRGHRQALEGANHHHRGPHPHSPPSTSSISLPGTGGDGHRALVNRNATSPTSSSSSSVPPKNLSTHQGMDHHNPHHHPHQSITSNWVESSSSSPSTSFYPTAIHTHRSPNDAAPLSGDFSANTAGTDNKRSASQGPSSGESTAPGSGSFLPGGATADGELLNQLAKNPEFVERLMNVDPGVERNWSDAERHQVQQIQQALRARGMGGGTTSPRGAQ